MLNLLKKLNNQKNILVVGDIMVDYFTYCKPIKKSAEVDINVCNIINEEYSLGGAANVWNNIKGFDVNCILCGAIGKDTFGDFVETNINDNNLIIYNEKTTTKHRFYENNKQVFRIDQDIICNFSNQQYSNVLSKINNMSLDAIIISDYRKGFCQKDFVENIIKIANNKNIFVSVDSKDTDISKFSNANLLKINKQEYLNLQKKEFDINDVNNIQKFLTKHNIKNLLVTLGEQGMTLVNHKGKVYSTNSIFVNNADVIGAGDCVLSSYTVGVLNNLSPIECLTLATNCASYCVSKIGTESFSIEKYKRELYGKNNQI